MRIYVGGISTETNTFSQTFMDIAQFKKGFWFIGDEMEAVKSTSKETRGVFDYLESQSDVEIVPGFVAHGITAGPVKKEDYNEMTKILLDTLKNSLPVDGVVLNMHGAMQSDDCFDCEGEIFEKVREIVGENIPVTASFDLHACITPKMIERLDGMAAFKTYPHTDHAATGYNAAKACVQLAREKIKPEKIYFYLPLILAVENCCTEQGPVVPIMNMQEELLSMDGVLSGALTLTQPWLDVPDLGCQISAFIKPDADRHVIENKMKEILTVLWDKRKDFEVYVPGIDEALEESKNCKAPVCISELGDIVSAGGSGDSTVALKALISRPDLRPACIVVKDKNAVEKALSTGIGNSALFEIKGETNLEYNSPVKVSAKVLFFNDKRVAPISNSEKGLQFDMGMRVTLKTEDDLYIILSQYPNYNHDSAMMTTMNVNPSDMKIIMQKTHQMFKEGYRGIMGTALYADTPGHTDRNIPRMPFKNIRRPIYPIDDIKGSAPIK